MGDISTRGLDFIKEREGFFAQSYLCPAGVWTIGWGTIKWDANRPVGPGETITREQAERLLLKEVQRVEDAIDATVKVPLTQGQFDALCSWGYNVGIGWITGKGHPQATLIRELNKGNYDRVPSELLKFKMANGKPLEGLLNRRKLEVKELWLADEEIASTNPATAPMAQHVEPAAGSAKEAVKSSWTIRGALVAFGATIADAAVDAYNWTFSVAQEAGMEIGTIKTAVGPFDTILFTLSKALPLIAIAGIAIVIARRISAAREGRIG